MQIFRPRRHTPPTELQGQKVTASLIHIVAIHQKQYGHAPNKLCGDRRFFSFDNDQLAYQEGVKRVSICKPGYRSKDRKQIEKERWFKTLQRFRAGIEGIISALMRSYGLKRCLWKGWESFQSYVGLSVVTFNLQKIVRTHIEARSFDQMINQGREVFPISRQHMR